MTANAGANAVVDDADRTQEICERNERIVEQRRQDAVRKSSDCCLECGLLIPSERQLILGGTELCADCAAELERRGY